MNIELSDIVSILIMLYLISILFLIHTYTGFNGKLWFPKYIEIYCMPFFYIAFFIIFFTTKITRLFCVFSSKILDKISKLYKRNEN